MNLGTGSGAWSSPLVVGRLNRSPGAGASRSLLNHHDHLLHVARIFHHPMGDLRPLFIADGARRAVRIRPLANGIPDDQVALGPEELHAAPPAAFDVVDRLAAELSFDLVIIAKAMGVGGRGHRRLGAPPLLRVSELFHSRRQLVPITHGKRNYTFNVLMRHMQLATVTSSR